MLRRVLSVLCLSTLLHTTAAEANNPCENMRSWPKRACQRLHQIWTQGETELYVTGYAWHNRYIYDPERVGSYNELAWGGGIGKGFYDEKGNYHGLAAIAFLDSHKNIEPAAGYVYTKIFALSEHTRFGAGYALLVTQRSDIFDGIPFPGLLPWLTFTYRKASVSATYIPGSQNVGNVLFLTTKWTF